MKKSPHADPYRDETIEKNTPNLTTNILRDLYIDVRCIHRFNIIASITTVQGSTYSIYDKID